MEIITQCKFCRSKGVVRVVMCCCSNPEEEPEEIYQYDDEENFAGCMDCQGLDPNSNSDIASLESRTCFLCKGEGHYKESSKVVVAGKVRRGLKSLEVGEKKQGFIQYLEQAYRMQL